MAEGVGFEPTDAFDVSGFQDRCNKPLYHPSKLLLQFQIMNLRSSCKVP